MSGAQLGSGAMANPDAYANMAAMGAPVAPQPTSAMFGVPPYNPSPPAPSGGLGGLGGFDLKSPLAQFAMNQALQRLQPRQGALIPPLQHISGLSIPQTTVRNPYGYKLGG